MKDSETMTMKLYKYLSLLVVAILSTVSVSAMELPVKTMRGQQYFYYEVKHGDTMYSLIQKFGLTRKEIVDNNPSAADFIKAGEVLYFPVASFKDKFEKTPELNIEPKEDVIEITYHTVKKGETLYGISRLYDIDQEKIVDYNPNVRYGGVKQGMKLKIPAVKNESETDSEAEATEVETEPSDVVTEIVPTAELTPVRPVISIAQTEEPAAEEAEASTDGPSSIAVMLPFMLESENVSRQAELYTDFYKGLLIAADTLSNRGDTVMIYAYDTMGDTERVKRLLQDDRILNSSVIIAPDEEAQIALLNAATAGSKTMVLNVFNVKDSSYIAEPNMVQSNIPHRLMYKKAYEAIEKYYRDHIPVFLRNESGRNDKAEFISYLATVYADKGIQPIEINYEGALMSSQLEVLEDNGSRYLIIPTSGSLSEFNKISHVLKSARDAGYDSERIAVFGYPDWTAFRGDAEAMLHALDATVYSRFYYNERGFDTRSLNSTFKRWYGKDMMEVVPNQAELGFDVGNMLIRNIRANDGYFNPESGEYTGAQSSFRFERSGDGGYINDEIYIIRFTPEGQVVRL